MTLHAAAIEVLVEKGHFEPKVAVAIAEAIDMAISGAQLVTVPVFESRLKELTTEFKSELRTEISALRQEFKSDIGGLCHQLTESIANAKVEGIRFTFLAVIGLVTVLTGMMYFMLQHVR
jgi:hypothetical protein